jgi:hypothetical protein
VFHPLAPNLSELSQDELTKKYNELMQRINQAYRFGPAGAVQQLQMLQYHYQEEMNRRTQKQLEEMEKHSKNFKNIIDIK